MAWVGNLMSKEPIAALLSVHLYTRIIHLTRLVQALLQKLQEELDESLQKNAEVSEGWKRVRQLSVPHELQQQITEQQAACAEIIKSKLQMIETIRAELRRKDDEYVRCLRRQAEDNDLLLSSLNNQLEEVQRAHKGELLGIESAFLQVSQRFFLLFNGEIEQVSEAAAMVRRGSSSFQMAKRSYQSNVKNTTTSNLLFWRGMSSLHKTTSSSSRACGLQMERSSAS